MCCFSMPVRFVAGTTIFARPMADGSQPLVYSMAFAAAEELAMIPPIPVPPGSAEDAVMPCASSIWRATRASSTT